MKFFALLITALILLSGCGQEVASENPDTSVNSEIVVKERKKPKIPVQADLLDKEEQDTEEEIDDIEQLLEEIDKDLNHINITEDDIRRGWYAGLETDKKYGTPNTWIWLDDSTGGRWMSTNTAEDVNFITKKDICASTAGTYIISCLDSEVEDCQYIPESKCECIENSRWYNDKEGCMLIDDKDEFVAMQDRELSQGWYKGLPNEKKLNTPPSWIWVESGEDSKWQNPGHYD